MTREEFRNYQEKYGARIDEIRQSAHDLHQQVNQTYGDNLPYGFHLDMVAQGVCEYGHLVCASEGDVLPLFFGAYYHDSIEDARLTYNDVKKTASRWLDDGQVLMAAEIVYALTNDKGRTRAERAGERYYAGIRATPYAPFVKACDRLANLTYSCSGDEPATLRMKEVYRGEMPHFLEAIMVESSDVRFQVPPELVAVFNEILT